MEMIDRERFGRFISTLRKEKGLTQRELAEQLHVSDKAVSKWERALSLPDITLLSPLSQVLGVSVAELLQGEHLAEDSTFSKGEVEKLVGSALTLSEEEWCARSAERKRRQRLWLLALPLAALELLLLHQVGTPLDQVWLVEVLMGIFSAYFSFFVLETLPRYYDENAISFYQHGCLRMSMAGVHFNNRNWPHIVRGLHGTMLLVMLVFPLLVLGLNWLSPALWAKGALFFTLASVFTIFIPVYILGRKYASGEGEQ